MMKKLIFCLLTLVGTGALGSCQQDEVANEVIENKGVTIRASLPANPASRVTLGDTSGNTTKVYWEADDMITLEIASQPYVFYIQNFEANQTTATFACPNGIPFVEGETYTFKYGSNKDEFGNDKSIGTIANQEGSLEDLSEYYYMEATLTFGSETDVNDLDLSFETKYAVVEIDLGGIQNVNSVEFKDMNDGQLVISNLNASIGEKVYFVIPGDAFDDFEPLITLTTTDNKVYAAMLLPHTMQAGHLYRINNINYTEVGSGYNNWSYTKNGNDFTITGTGELASDFRTILIKKGEINNIYSITFNDFTAIGDYVCQSMYYLTSITFPKTITSIGQGVVSGDYAGNITITCKATDPPALSDLAFFVPEKISAIKVPSESVNAYKEASGWSTYASKIEAITEP